MSESENYCVQRVRGRKRGEWISVGSFYLFINSLIKKEPHLVSVQSRGLHVKKKVFLSKRQMTKIGN